MTIFTFALKRSFRSKSNLIFLLLLPIICILLPTQEWQPLPLGFQYYGIILLFSASRVVVSIMQDRATGVLLRIGVSPVTHFHYLFQSLLAYSLILIGQSALVVFGGRLVHGEVIKEPLLLFVVYAIFSLTAVAFCLAWNSLYRNKETALLLLMNVIILMAMLGGVMWPMEIMPEFLQRTAMLLPTYWLVEAVRTIIYEEGTRALLFPVSVILLFTIAFLLLGSKRRLV
ncbi:ABC transporter permease [Sutcliffiella halmapala]|uniref:ABC transporter permease n=1 Tax=Sutcliffiella halmapala TaxID=79882 RepID=UPI000995CD4D|nr:ABC transporter permease [Sutcliffiella halmapala]